MIRNSVIAIIMTGGICLVGCDIQAAGLVTTPHTPAQATQSNYMPQTAIKADPQTEGATAVESALAWSGKYAEQSERLLAIQEERQQLEKDNRRLLANQAKLLTELEQTQKELEEANDMLIQMRTELDKWKANILGFREEMQATELAQTQALRRVLELLGGEMPTETKTEAPETDETKKDVAQ